MGILSVLLLPKPNPIPGRPESLRLMRKNNFDIVRLVLASVVVLVHTSDLSLVQQLEFIPHFLNSRIAVEGFFAISGFLIFASYDRCKSLSEYFQNRAWRILPGYWVSTLFCLAIAFSLGHYQVGKWLVANLTFLNFLQPGIPGVFTSNPSNDAMNGALWTIKIELMFYAAVPPIVWVCRRLNRDAVLWTLLMVSIIFRTVFAANEKLSIQLPGQLSFFLVGTLVYYHLDWFKRNGTWLMACAAAAYGLHVWTHWFFLRPFAIAGLTMGACMLLPHIEGPTKFGDFSYGTYILHYPIIQLMIRAGFFNIHPWWALLGTVSLVAGAAMLSWFFIEKPSLAHSKSRRVRQAALHQAANYPPAVP